MSQRKNKRRICNAVWEIKVVPQWFKAAFGV